MICCMVMKFGVRDKLLDILKFRWNLKGSNPFIFPKVKDNPYAFAWGLSSILRVTG